VSARAARDEREPVRAAIALGSNLGPRRRQLASALRALDAEPGIEVCAVSRWLANPAQGGPEGQPDYWNGAALLATTLGARELLERMLEIEREHGRARPDGVPNAPRTLDLDLLTYGDAVIDEPGLQVPHPRMLERAFVLGPLVELAPDAVHPRTGTTFARHLERLRAARAEPGTPSRGRSGALGSST